MARRSLVDQYVDNGMHYVAKGNVPQARLMLKTALASDKSGGDVRVLLDVVDSMTPTSPFNNPPSRLTVPVSAIHN